jgi:hypothetical protein
MPDSTPNAQSPPVYKRLPGNGANFLERITLYLATDHLLYVSSTGFSESYRRFYFRDIHAITVRKTAVGAFVNVLSSSFFFFAWPAR